MDWYQVKRWHGFRVFPAPERPGKLRKVPVSVGGRAIDATNPENWSTHFEAVAAFQAGVFNHLGFALGPDGTGNHWQGIDLDEIEANGLQWLADILPGYVERSVSGKGVHAIGYGKPFRTFDHFGIEAYSEKRSFVVTGNVIRGSL